MRCTPWKTQLVSGHSAFAPPFLPWCFLSPSHPQTILLVLEEIGRMNIHILSTRGDWCQGQKCASVQVTAKKRDFLKNVENIRYYYWCIFQEVYFGKKIYCNTVDSNTMKIPNNTRRQKNPTNTKKSQQKNSPKNQPTKPQSTQNSWNIQISQPLSKKSEGSTSWTKGIYIWFTPSIKIRQKA